MKAQTTLIGIALAVGLAAVAGAQVFDPPRNKWERRAHPNQASLWFTGLDWNVPGDPRREGFAIAGEFTINDNMTAGIWAGRDEEDFTPDQEWLELHLAYYFHQSPKHVLGVSLGTLHVDIDGFDTANWWTLMLVGSTKLDPEARGGSRWTLGYNLGALNGRESGSGAFTTSDGVSYGVNLGYRVNETFSVGFAWWRMDLDNGTQIDRTSLGAGLRF